MSETTTSPTIDETSPEYRRARHRHRYLRLLKKKVTTGALSDVETYDLYESTRACGLGDGNRIQDESAIRDYFVDGGAARAKHAELKGTYASAAQALAQHSGRAAPIIAEQNRLQAAHDAEFKRKEDAERLAQSYEDAKRSRQELFPASAFAEGGAYAE